ncbi:hypothetical protein ABZ078_31100 [Streptomyces sp. NPDC006385]|uniref:hypothetical protein n=1 Tax=Streptomyces sp. NPDC006385 TaxID=3156761 RepID=UPI0033A0E59E
MPRPRRATRALRRQYGYRAYAPEEALLTDLFWEAWHCHEESAFPRAWGLFDAAVIRLVG